MQDSRSVTPARSVSQAEAHAPRSFWQSGPRSLVDMRRRMSRSSRRIALYAYFAFEVFCLTFLQKFVIPIDLHPIGIQANIGSIEVAAPLTYLAMLILFIFVPPRIDLVRLLLFVNFIFWASLSTVLITNTYSVNSVLLMLTIYIPFIFVIDVGETTYRNMINIFLNVMIGVGVIVLAQHVMQLMFTWRSWPNLDKIIPDSYRFHGFIYIQPIKFGSQYMKPNGIFFLEVSYVSEWTATALALELVYFRRFWRMAFYSIIILSLFAGTGVLLLLITLPVLLTRLSRRTIAAVAIIFVVVSLFAAKIHWYSQVQQRFGEYHNQQSSANKRFVEPFVVLMDFIGHKDAVFIGEGPGNGSKENFDFWWVPTKVSFEYGIMSALSFTAFLIYVLFYKAPSQRIAFLLFVLFNFMGGFIVPIYPFLLFLIGGMFRVHDGRAGA